ncbi:MAG: amidase [Xanthomonadales bacterium]|nr:amidase [Xanthomonadales bacterium]
MAGMLTRREFSRLLGGGLLGAAMPAFGGTGPTVAAAPSSDDLLSAPVTAIAAAIRQREVSAAELTLAYLRRIEALNPQLNAIVHVGAEQAMAAARAADAALAHGDTAGALHGVPMTLKDSIDTAGMQTTCGTLGRSRFVPAQDATVAARLKAAGAVLLGKTNTPELTLSFETDNLVFGRTKNPFDPDRSPGGSSGGAAAAVTASLCAFDIGSDTGGSIRVPSHFCGTAGLKPSQGRVPRTGHVVSFGGVHDQLTQLGPIARSVADLDLLLRVIAGPDGRDPFVAPVPLGDPAAVGLPGLRVAWHADNGLFTPTPEIQATTADAARALQRAGAKLTEAVPPLPGSVDELLDLYAWMTDGGAWIQRLLDAAGTTTPSPVIAEQIDAAAELGSAELTRILSARDAFRASVLTFMEEYDALVTPVVGFPAPLFGATEDAAHFPGYVYTQVFNLSGLPAAVVRCGTAPGGLPIGVQVAAQPWREDVALAVALQLERDFGGWRAPPDPS